MIPHRVLHRGLAFWALLATLGSPALAAIIQVPGDHPTILEAVQFAMNGDTIVVGSGVYQEQVDFQGKDIVIRSADGPATTILDGQGLYTVVRFVSGEGASARIEGFTITNGQGLQGFEAGGIWCHQSAPTIVNCIVTGNHGSDAQGRAGSGGIGGDAASPTIEGCVVELNVGGRGIGNSTSYGGAGGIGLDRAGIPGTFGSGIVIRGCQIRNNRGGDLAAQCGDAGPGGVYLGHAIAIVEDSVVRENVGGDVLPGTTDGEAGAGGVRCWRAAAHWYSCRILLNDGGRDLNQDTDDRGGVGGIGMEGRLPTAPTQPGSLVNTVIAWNEGGDGDGSGGTGGVLVDGAWLDATNSAVVGNVGGVAAVPSGESVGGMDLRDLADPWPTTVSNTIFWINQGQGGGSDDYRSYAGPDPTTTNLLIGVDPEFVDLANDDFHLRCFSPAVDAGTDAAPALPASDFDGDARIIGSQVDIGPDEALNTGSLPTYCASTSNSSGIAAEISATGCTSIAHNELRVFVDGLPNTPGLLFYGPNQLQVTFGDGFRCVGGAVRRLRPAPGMGASITIDLDLSSLQVSPGVQSNFQYWFRDPMAGGAGFNLSDGLQVDFQP